jgi:ATP-dependent DNA helicase RecG
MKIKAVLYVKENGKITNGEYQTINDCSRNTAFRDLVDLVEKELFETSENKGIGSFYFLKM